MIRAYDEILRDRACDCLGRMLDYAVRSLHMDADSVMGLFIASGRAALFSRGDVRLTAGMSGIELAYDVLEKSGLRYERIPPRHTAGLSNEYWCGYAFAHAQWHTLLPFEEITELHPPGELISAYSAERTALLGSLPADISEEARAQELRRFGEAFAATFAESLLSSGGSGRGGEGSCDTRLKKLRIKNGLSQSGLAEASGVPLRTLQQYEQRQKDINKAHFEYIIMLSSALSCDPSDLLERV